MGDIERDVGVMEVREEGVWLTLRWIGGRLGIGVGRSGEASFGCTMKKGRMSMAMREGRGEGEGEGTDAIVSVGVQVPIEVEEI